MALQARATAAGNELDVDGRWASEAAQDRWQVKAALPALAALRPLATLSGALPAQRWPQAGAAQLQGQLEGRWPALGGNGTLQSTGVRIRRLHAAGRPARLAFRRGRRPDVRCRSHAEGAEPRRTAPRRVAGARRRQPARAPDAACARTARCARPHGARTCSAPPRAARAPNCRGRAGMARGRRGRRHLAGPRHRTARRCAQQQHRLDRGAAACRRCCSSMRGAACRARPRWHPAAWCCAGGAALRWTEAAWRAEGQRFDLISRARAARRGAAAGAAATGDRLGRRSDACSGASRCMRPSGSTSTWCWRAPAGDLRIADETGAPQSLGIGELQLAFSAHDGVWRFAQGAARAPARRDRRRANGSHERPGALAAGRARRWKGWCRCAWPTSAAWGTWVPPGWRLGGNLQVNAALGGRFGAPELRGELRGAELSVRNVLQGVNLTEGELQASLEGSVARVQRLHFKSGDGRLQLSGDAVLGDTPSARLHLEAERFRLLGRVDRAHRRQRQRRSAAGARVAQARRPLHRRRGAVRFQQVQTRRSLDEDVVVVRAASAPGAARRRARPACGHRRPCPPRCAKRRSTSASGLGENLQVRGRGLDAKLRGDLRLSTPGGRLAVQRRGAHRRGHLCSPMRRRW